ncbi:MAG: hypothetical protein ED859_05545 [Desulfuromonadales bacterium]|nr:MAG: hypothetical protein ED859_05545 [Desulfuromonadales bacterium]
MNSARIPAAAGDDILRAMEESVDASNLMALEMVIHTLENCAFQAETHVAELVRLGGSAARAMEANVEMSRLMRTA